MHVMRRLKSIASGRSSISDPGGDSGSKRVKVDQDVEGKILKETRLGEDTTQSIEQHITSTSLETDASTSNVASIARTEKDGLDQLPKELHEMKIRDDKSDSHDDKDMEATVVNGNGTETGQIISTTIGGRNGQPRQTISYMAERVVSFGPFGVVFQEEQPGSPSPGMG
eukprot:TRINITY_DN1779_c0_g1_i9.p1 TRINITY_DN1779_c0_g1~~TRINITY_DN1779_c0_g1_i9.p1  ORF type:complete len:169 (-),score=37.92 TRINITY_DN1779_c0_g1_i9:662-1168(-)